MSSNGQSGILKAIGEASMERRQDGNLVVRFPVRHTAVFAPTEEIKARELFQSVARKEVGYPSGFNPNAPAEALANAATPPETFNARGVRQLCREVPLSIFHEFCSVDISKLLGWIDAGGGDPAEKNRVKQKLLRFQAGARLEAKK